MAIFANINELNDLDASGHWHEVDNIESFNLNKLKPFKTQPKSTEALPFNNSDVLNKVSFEPGYNVGKVHAPLQESPRFMSYEEAQKQENDKRERERFRPVHSFSDIKGALTFINNAQESYRGNWDTKTPINTKREENWAVIKNPQKNLFMVYREGQLPAEMMRRLRDRGLVLYEHNPYLKSV